MTLLKLQIYKNSLVPVCRQRFRKKNKLFLIKLEICVCLMARNSLPEEFPTKLTWIFFFA